MPPRRTPLAVVLALVAAVFLAACSSGPEADATGAEIYQQTCAGCHGGNLEGGTGPPLGPGSNAAGQPDEYLATTIERGRGRMPAFGSTLDPQQIERVIGFIREMQEA